MPTDKLKHIAVGLVLGLASLIAPGLGAVLALVVGAAKEIRDATGKGTPDGFDFIATSVAGVGVDLLITSLRFI